MGVNLNKYRGTIHLWGILCTLLICCVVLTSAIPYDYQFEKQSDSTESDTVENADQASNEDNSDGNTSNALQSMVLNQPRHKLSSGDVIRVIVYTPEYNYYDVWLDTNGMIKLPLLGEFKAEGLTCSELSHRLEKAFLKYFRKINVDVRLTIFGYFWVLFIGSDYKGDMPVVQNGTSLMQMLNKFKVDTNGKNRRITLIRGAWNGEASNQLSPNITEPNEVHNLSNLPLNKNQLPIAKLINQRGWLAQLSQRKDVEVNIIDPTEQTVEGNIERTNITLKRGDIIYIPAPEQLVKVEGTVKEGLFELLPGENLGQILKLAGSFGIDSDLRNTVVKRYDEKGKLSQLVINLQPTLTDTSIIEQFDIRNRDIISFIKPNSKVYVIGQVTEPGAFDYDSTLNVVDYLAQAKGYTKEADLKVITVVRGARGLNTKDTPPTIATVINLRSYSTGDNRNPEFRIEPGDVIFVPDQGFQWKPDIIMQGIGAIISGFAVSRN